jgi:hypothetical protein
MPVGSLRRRRSTAPVATFAQVRQTSAARTAAGRACRF